MSQITYVITFLIITSTPLSPCIPQGRYKTLPCTGCVWSCDSITPLAEITSPLEVKVQEIRRRPDADEHEAEGEQGDEADVVEHRAGERDPLWRAADALRQTVEQLPRRRGEQQRQQQIGQISRDAERGDRLVIIPRRAREQAADLLHHLREAIRLLNEERPADHGQKERDRKSVV